MATNGSSLFPMTGAASTLLVDTAWLNWMPREKGQWCSRNESGPFLEILLSNPYLNVVCGSKLLLPRRHDERESRKNPYFDRRRPSDVQARSAGFARNE